MISTGSAVPAEMIDAIAFVRTGTAHSHMVRGERVVWREVSEDDAPHIRVTKTKRTGVYSFAFHSNKKNIRDRSKALAVVEYGSHQGASVFHLIKDRRIEQD